MTKDQAMIHTLAEENEDLKAEIGRLRQALEQHTSDGWVKCNIRHQINVMRAQKNIELNGPIEEINNYIQALSRIYELVGDEPESNMSKRNLTPQEQLLIITLDSIPGKENQNLRALVAQEYIQQFGPIKDDIGDYVKKLLAGE